MNSPLPPELERRWGMLPFIRQHGNNEWSSACPKCGDSGHAGHDAPDRFRMFSGEHARGWCRRCGYQEFADSDKKNFVVTPEMRAQWLAERVAREQAELKKATHALELLKREAQWVKWHEDMTLAQRDIWHVKGVPDWAIDYYQLGYCPHKSVWSSGSEFDTPTMTIPVYAPGWDLVNIRHRLLNPIDPNDKYRPDRAGIPAQLYLTNPDEKPSGQVILVEGEIKSIVVYDRLGDYKTQVIGLPGKNPRDDLLAKLSDCDRVWIVLDPDAARQAFDIGRKLGNKRARIVTLPCKPDDAFTMFGAEPQDFRAAMRYGRMVL